MKKLGFISDPEQYASAEDLVFIENSVEARTFFEEEFGKGGIVFLGSVFFNSLRYPCLIFWLHIDTRKKSIISMIPAFRLDNYTEIFDLQLLEVKPISSDTFIFWKDEVFAAILTSTGEIVIKKIRSILTENDMLAILQLEGTENVVSVYPVGIYSLETRQFVCTCWSIEVENIENVFWLPVCHDDMSLIRQFEKGGLTEYPVELGETVVIGGENYTLCYCKDLGSYFNRNEVQSKLSIAQSDMPNEQILNASEPEPTMQTQIFSIKTNLKNKKSVNGKCRVLNIDGSTNDEKNVSSTNRHSRIIPFKPKK